MTTNSTTSRKPTGITPRESYRLCVQCRLVWVEYRVAICPDCIKRIKRESAVCAAKTEVAK